SRLIHIALIMESIDRQRTIAKVWSMSALGHKRTFAAVMSALPLKADICGAPRDVCFVPKADMARLIR
ncbi:MAG: hypothetical protein WBC87_02170, partial [Pseudolabrys sp.]